MIECNNKQICINCNEHFQNLRPKVKEVVISAHFKRDFPDFDTDLIVKCENIYFTRLHKFEEKIQNNYIFRAVYNKKHIVYAIDKNYRLIFLRAFSNFNEYGKFLNDKKRIIGIIEKS